MIRPKTNVPRITKIIVNNALIVGALEGSSVSNAGVKLGKELGRALGDKLGKAIGMAIGEPHGWQWKIIVE